MKKFLKEKLPSSIWYFLRRCHRWSFLNFRRCFELLGYNIIPKNNYYSPLPVESELRNHVQRWYKPSRLVGIKYDLEQLKKKLLKMVLNYQAEFSQHPEYNQIVKKGFGPGYTPLDALTLYMMIRDRKPKHYIEIGSGVSTYYCYLAAKKNEAEGYPLKITCIEPYPYKQLYSIPRINIMEREVQDIELSFFQNLEENDILFIDSSHVLKIDSDVHFLYLEILPTLAKGILIHIHDISFPYNIPYPPELWIFSRGWPMFWNEAMVLQAFLCFNEKFKILMSTPLIRYFEETFLQQNIANYESIKHDPNSFSSLWLQKIN